MIWHAMALGLGIFAVNNHVAPSAEVVHVSNSFHCEVAAPMERVAPLFGPEGERGWAGNDDVRAMGESDRESGLDWQKSIERCLGAGR